jgi:AraC-like DNA-binding protein
MADVVLNQHHGDRPPLDDALLRLTLRDSRLCQSILGAPWGLAVPETPDAAVFLTAARGPCLVRVDDTEWRLEPGDFLLLPRGHAHTVHDVDGTAPLGPGALRWDSVQGRCILDAGGDGESTWLITGCLVFEVSPLIAALPAQLLLRRDDGRGWQGGVADVLRSEALRPGPGSEVVLSHLAGLLAIGAIRHWLDARDSADGFLRALRTPQIRRALDALHADPTRTWTLDSLARAAGMSRSAFSQQFHEVVGEPPIRYWTRWRMSVARQWLRDGTYTVEQAADVLGYRSRAAFSRAFKSSTGEAPGRARRAGLPKLQTLNDRIAAAT